MDQSITVEKHQDDIVGKNYFVAGCSVLGNGHKKHNVPIQDAFAVKYDPDSEIYVIVVSDGAGSAPKADVGAQACVKSLSDSFMQVALSLTSNEISPNIVREKISFAIMEHRNSLDPSGHELKKFHHTMSAAIITPQGGVLIYIGDSPIVLIGKKPEESIADIAVNEKKIYRHIDLNQTFHISEAEAEYSNQTNFITQSNWQENLKIVKITPNSLFGILVMTDGAASAYVNNQTKHLHMPLIEATINQWMDNKTSRSAVLHELLTHPDLNAITADDKTCVALFPNSLKFMALTTGSQTSPKVEKLKRKIDGTEAPPPKLESMTYDCNSDQAFLHGKEDTDREPFTAPKLAEKKINPQPLQKTDESKLRLEDLTKRIEALESELKTVRQRISSLIPEHKKKIVNISALISITTVLFVLFLSKGLFPTPAPETINQIDTVTPEQSTRAIIPPKIKKQPSKLENSTIGDSQRTGQEVGTTADNRIQAEGIVNEDTSQGPPAPDSGLVKEPPIPPSPEKNEVGLQSTPAPETTNQIDTVKPEQSTRAITPPKKKKQTSKLVNANTGASQRTNQEVGATADNHIQAEGIVNEDTSPLSVVGSPAPEAIPVKEPPVTPSPEKNEIGLQSKTQKKISHLYVEATPANARIRILNIKPKYERGMSLEPGDYTIEVSAKGYVMITKNVILKEGINSLTFHCSLAKDGLQE